uniref:NADH-ubiquinone oxidoreductase chain 4L n=5 Tax=Phasianidae TaxID=9005 RepID=A0A514LRQ7_9GALL|nr:NADH dehydrogenase subunit 4L [Pucrasia macrolopha]YP_009678591.1 NADH dehydrogenase subunit 4L [Tetrao parvirostris parvirostris]YP_009678604.1 NADH dehydrogenase subunit 4L [Tetrao parvirostris kamtschaticus]AZQ21173.1 NADH dehydrogenase subunit 4L [Tetrao urogallus aquitanicus]QXU60393.1 NADH dehydrogenase subunit 4L [Tetrao urogalloides]ACR44451.1 NADH dehydrogenase subunit 4L [Pucrasia macrolopha]QDI94332.1 NADH dehydrogenase subunit 4L [Tetrao parvirostris parvirostris]QDI94345.1 NA
MSPLHFSFYSAFTFSSLGLAFHRTHLISALLCLESMMLSMFIPLSVWSVENQTPSFTLVPILMLAFSACEAGTGLAMLVASTRTHGSDHLHNLNLLQC